MFDRVKIVSYPISFSYWDCNIVYWYTELLSPPDIVLWYPIYNTTIVVLTYNLNSFVSAGRDYHRRNPQPWRWSIKAEWGEWVRGGKLPNETSRSLTFHTPSVCFRMKLFSVSIWFALFVQFQTEETSPSRNLVARQISNSAPTSLVDIESLVHQELVREQESLRDRRKKDIHNMSELLMIASTSASYKFLFLFCSWKTSTLQY